MWSKSALIAGQIVSGLGTALSLSLNLASVAEVTVDNRAVPWEVLALTTFIAFVILSAVERYRLSAEIASFRGNRGRIARLTELAANLRSANDSRGSRAFFFGSDEKRSRATIERERAEDEAVAQAKEASRAFLAADLPEYLDEWDRAKNPKEAAEVLGQAIAELRRRG